MELRGKFGFKVYNTTDVIKPFPKGFVHEYKITVVDAAYHVTVLAVLALVIGLII